MPIDPAAAMEITGYSWVPPFARGLVRDLRIRWVLEEMGERYAVRLFDRRTTEADARQPDQPFGQVPAFREGDVAMFESGAICLHLAERSDALLPCDPVARARTLSWAVAALNSIEPWVLMVQSVSLFDRDRPGAAEFAPTAVERLNGKLAHLAVALGDREWLAGSFTVADILMVHVLVSLRRSGILAGHPALAAYVARGEARPAYQAALAAQMADFIPDKEEV